MATSVKVRVSADPSDTATLLLVAVKGPMVDGVEGMSRARPDAGTGDGMAWS